MEVHIPSDITVAMVLLVAAVSGTVLWLGRKVRITATWLVFVLLGWLGFTAALSSTGVLAEFSGFPPWIPILILIEFAFCIWLVLLSHYRDELARIPQYFLIPIMSFRIAVELILLRLFTESLIPVEMTFYGRNFDIVPGLLALPLAFVVYRWGEDASRWLIVGWNLLGLALVTNVFAHGILAIPYPMQVLHLSVDNVVVAYFPMQWLPLFLVPVAYSLHLISLRRLVLGRHRVPVAALEARL